MTFLTRRLPRYGMAFALACLASPAARAQVVTPLLDYTLITPDVTAAPGDTVTFEAELTDTSDTPLYLNTDAGLVDLPLSVDDSAFIASFVSPTPQPVLPDDGLPHTFALFAVVLPSDPALYTGLPLVFDGTFTLYGGLTDGDTDLLGSQPFSVTLSTLPGGGGGPVPEPGSLGLLCGLTGAGVSGAWRHKRHAIRRAAGANSTTAR